MYYDHAICVIPWRLEMTQWPPMTLNIALSAFMKTTVDSIRFLEVQHDGKHEIVVLMLWSLPKLDVKS